MPRPRFERMEEERKKALLDAAEREFGQRPYEAASINRILDEAGFSKGSFYHYFDDKEDLAATVAFRSYQRPLAIMRDLKDPATTLEFWSEFARVNWLMTERIESDHVAYEAMVRLGNLTLRSPTFLARVVAPMSEVMERFMRFLTKGQELGAVRTDLTVQQIIALQRDLKSSIWKATFSPEQMPTHLELEAFLVMYLDLLKRLLLPASVLKEAP